MSDEYSEGLPFPIKEVEIDECPPTAVPENQFRSLHWTVNRKSGLGLLSPLSSIDYVSVQPFPIESLPYTDDGMDHFNSYIYLMNSND